MFAQSNSFSDNLLVVLQAFLKIYLSIGVREGHSIWEGCKLFLYRCPSIRETLREHPTLTLLAELTRVFRFLLLLDNIFYSSLNACNSLVGLVSALGAALVKARLPWVLGAVRKFLGSSSTNMMKSLFPWVFF